MSLNNIFINSIDKYDPWANLGDYSDSSLFPLPPLNEDEIDIEEFLLKQSPSYDPQCSFQDFNYLPEQSPSSNPQCFSNDLSYLFPGPPPPAIPQCLSSVQAQYSVNDLSHFLPEQPLFSPQSQCPYNNSSYLPGPPPPPITHQDLRPLQDRPHNSALAVKPTKRKEKKEEKGLWRYYGYDPHAMNYEHDFFMKIRGKFFMSIAQGTPVCKKLIEEYPSLIHTKLNNGATPVDAAIKQRNGDLVTYFLKKEALAMENMPNEMLYDLAKKMKDDHEELLSLQKDGLI